MKKTIITIVIFTLGITIVNAAPYFRQEATILPISNNAYDLGTSTKTWRNIFISGSDGCLTLTSNLITSTGSACGSGGGGTIDGTGFAGMMASWVDSNTLRATSTLVGSHLHATSTTATSTIAGPFGVNGYSYVGPYLYDGLYSNFTGNYSPDNYIADFTKDIDDYASLNVTNPNNGTSASVDITLNNDLTNDLDGNGEYSYFADIGLNSSTYNVPFYGLQNVPNMFYMYNSDGPVNITAATSSTAGYIQFLTGGFNSEAARFTSTGALGVGSTSPNSRLVVTNPLSTNTVVIEDASSDSTPFIINASGDVGISTTSPVAKFSVSTDKAATSGSHPGTTAQTVMFMQGGAGGDTTATAGSGGTGSAITLITGAGGDSTASASTAFGGAGGQFTVNGGNGGTATSGTTRTGGTGGTLFFRGGTGGAPTGGTTNTGGSGGPVIFTGGNAGAGIEGNGGNGGAASIVSGAGGNSTSGNGGNGGSYAAATAAGGTSSTGTGGTGGLVTFLSGAGGASTSGTGGSGGSVTFRAGTGGAGVTGGNAGNINIHIAGGVGGAGTTGNGGTGTSVLMGTGAGGASTAATGGNAGDYTFTGGTGGTGATTAGTGGSFYVLPGNSASTTKIGNVVLGCNSSATCRGNVGVGTTSPYAKLSVVGPVVAEYFHATSTTAVSTFANSIYVNNTITGNNFDVYNSANINFYSDEGVTAAGTLSALGTGELSFTPLSGGNAGYLNFNNITATRNYTFPDVDGTLTTGTGLAGMMTAWSDTNTLIATSTIVAGNFHATSTTATSTVNGPFLTKTPIADVRAFGAKGDGVTDDTTAIQAALDSNRNVYVPNGTYIVSNLTLNNNQKLYGDGASSTLRFKTGSTGFMLEANTNGVFLTNLGLDGGNSQNYSAVGAAGNRSGIHLSEFSYNSIIDNVAVFGFNNIGIALNGNSSTQRIAPPTITNTNVYMNYVGIDTGYLMTTSTDTNGGEYVRISAIDATFNRIGVRIASGNVILNNSIIETNGYGIYIAGIQNNSHGTIVGNLINHNTVYGLYATDSENGMSIIGNQSFYGDWYLNNVTGFNIQGNTFKGGETDFFLINGGTNYMKGNWFTATTPVFSRTNDDFIISDNFYATSTYALDKRDLIVDSNIAYTNGNFGIGTSSPYAKLSVAGQVVGQYFVATSSTASIFPALTLSGITGSTQCLQADSSGVVSGTGSACGAGGGGSGGGTWSTTTSSVSGRLINYPNNATDIVTIGSNATTSAETFFDPNTNINYFSGNVGIGITNPTYPLHIVNNSNAVLSPYISNNSAGASAQAVYQTSNGTSIANYGITGTGYTTYGSLLANTAYLYSTSAVGLHLMSDNATGVIKFSAGGTSEMMRLSANGNFGIGTTSPYSKLSVAGQVVAQNFIATSSTASIFPALTLSGITGSTQCLQANSSGVVSGTGSACGSGGGSSTVGGFSRPASSTLITLDLSTYATSTTIHYDVGTANMTINPINATSSLGAWWWVEITAPATGLIGSTTISYCNWNGQINPGSNTVNGLTDRFKIFATASTTNYLACDLEGTY